MSEDQASVKVTRGIDTFARLVDLLKRKRFGCYIVWIHEHQVARVASVSRPAAVDDLVDVKDVKGA